MDENYCSCEAHTYTNAFTHTNNSHKTLDLFNGKECDVSQGEQYVGGSSGKVSDYAACKKSCMDAAACQSVTFYRDGWCSHFSTACENTKVVNNANALTLL